MHPGDWRPDRGTSGGSPSAGSGNRSLGRSLIARCCTSDLGVDAPAQTSESLPPAAVTLNDVLDRVVQREHLFMAQMRHMHPLVETYLQDLKNDSDGNHSPSRTNIFWAALT